MVIGGFDVTVKALATVGDRRDHVVTVQGPGDATHTFPLSLTRSLLATWRLLDDSAEDEAVEELARTIIGVRGTASEPPAEGYWFDTYNSERSLADTCNKVRNTGDEPFRKNRTVSDELGRVLAPDVLNLLAAVDEAFLKETEEPLTRSIDMAFEASEAQEDLGSTPNDKPGFLYRVCILSVIIDRFGIRLSIEPTDTGSLVALGNWIDDRKGPGTSDEILKPLRMIKNLRKQYPIHEQYEENAEGQREVRREIRRAIEFFGLRDGDHAGNWAKVIGAFCHTLQQLNDEVL